MIAISDLARFSTLRRWRGWNRQGNRVGAIRVHARYGLEQGVKRLPGAVEDVLTRKLFCVSVIQFPKGPVTRLVLGRPIPICPPPSSKHTST